MKNSMFTKKELHKFSMTWTWRAQLGWNYERMQGLGYLASMVPVIDKIYANDPEMKMKALKTHSQFFNVTPAMGNIIMGMDVAIEEQNPNEQGLEMAASIKTALMGPFSGIGDTIFGMVAGAIFGSIAASMAVNGSSIGVIIWVAWNFFVFFIRQNMFDLGYKQGAALVTTMSDKMNAITEAASVIGLTVVGGMIATMVRFNLNDITLNLHDSDGQIVQNVLPLQTYADSLMPMFFPALFGYICYTLLGKKWMNSNKLIWCVIAFSILMTALGIVG